MPTRNFLGISLGDILVQSTAATSTLSNAATDLGPFFNVGRREVKFLVALYNSPISSATGVITVTINQGSSASSANSTSTLMSIIPGADGSSATWTISSGTSSTSFEWHGLVSSRYVQLRVSGTTSAVVTTYAVAAFALPMVRNI